jgi:hypothetical protein
MEWDFEEGWLVGRTSSPVAEWLAAEGLWLSQHPALSALLLFVLPVALAYWYFAVRPYALAEHSKAGRERIISPIMLGPLAGSFVPALAERPLEDVGLGPFGQWLMPYLLLRGLTAGELARQLGRPAAAIRAVMGGAPVGSHLPSAALVDAICAHLHLDQGEARSAFLSVVSPALRESRPR